MRMCTMRDFFLVEDCASRTKTRPKVAGSSGRELAASAGSTGPWVLEKTDLDCRDGAGVSKDITLGVGIPIA
jgi:hypothetical protein